MDVVGAYKDSGRYDAVYPPLSIDVDLNVPFVLNETVPIEAEMASVMNQILVMLIKLIFRVFCVLLYTILVLLFLGTCIFRSDYFYAESKGPPLQDRIHSLLDPYHHPFNTSLCNVFMHTLFFITIIRLFLFTPLFYTLLIISRYSSIYATSYLIRGIFIYMTTLPAVDHNCDPNLENTFFPSIPRIARGFADTVTNCSDLIISGHTMFTIFGCHVFCSNIKYLWAKILCISMSLFVLFLIIASKYHYTVDVIFGLILSLMLVYYYDTKVDDIGVHVYNKIYNSSSKAFRDARRTVIRETFLARFIVKMELLEERMVLGQKMRVLYDLVNGQKDLIDPKLLKKFNRYVRLFGADETDDLLALYRGSRKFNFYYWTSLYRMIFKRNKNVPAL